MGMGRPPKFRDDKGRTLRPAHVHIIMHTILAAWARKAAADAQTSFGTWVGRIIEAHKERK